MHGGRPCSGEAFETDVCRISGCSGKDDKKKKVVVECAEVTEEVCEEVCMEKKCKTTYINSCKTLTKTGDGECVETECKVKTVEEPKTEIIEVCMQVPVENCTKTWECQEEKCWEETVEEPKTKKIELCRSVLVPCTQQEEECENIPVEKCSEVAISNNDQVLQERPKECPENRMYRIAMVCEMMTRVVCD